MQKLTFKPFATLGKTNETLRLSEDGRRLAEDKKVRTSRGSDGLGQDGASDHGGERTFKQAVAGPQASGYSQPHVS